MGRSGSPSRGPTDLPRKTDRLDIRISPKLLNEAKKKLGRGLAKNVRDHLEKEVRSENVRTKK